MLVGYGLVVGLNGTGDDLDSAVFTRESLIGMLQRLGVNARDEDLDSENVAAVMVTADLPPFSRQGTRRSEEHTSELQSLMRISYAVFCLKKKKQKNRRQ